jgi:hypothetical protein
MDCRSARGVQYRVSYRRKIVVQWKSVSAKLPLPVVLPGFSGLWPLELRRGKRPSLARIARSPRCNDSVRYQEYSGHAYWAA